MLKRIVIKSWKVYGANGYRYLLECNQCHKEFELGGNNYNKGRGLLCSKHCRSLSSEWKIKLSKSLKSGFKNGRIHPRGMLGKKAWNKGIPNPEIQGDKNWNWNNGSSYGEYGPEFNRTLKEKIRQRDNNHCQLCGNESKNKLDIHHIDYNKKNNAMDNLISLCHNCHMKTNPNKNRKKYQAILVKAIKLNYDICRPLAIDKTSEK